MTRYKTIKMTHRCRAVGSKQRACLRGKHIGWNGSAPRFIVLTVNTSQPVSAFRSCASRCVRVNTSRSLDGEGLGQELGLRKANRCLIEGGRCLTMVGAWRIVAPAKGAGYQRQQPRADQIFSPSLKSEFGCCMGNVVRRRSVENTIENSIVNQ
jgi:hypothetical protein